MIFEVKVRRLICIIIFCWCNTFLLAQKTYSFEDSTFRYEVIEDSLYSKKYSNGNFDSYYSFSSLSVYLKASNTLFQKLSVSHNIHEKGSFVDTLKIGDINFDGFDDVGILIKNWDSIFDFNKYHYWLFDSINNKFVETEIYDTLDISYFDNAKKELHCNTKFQPCAYWGNRVYQYEGAKLLLISEVKIIPKQNGTCSVKRRLYYSKKRHKLFLLSHTRNCGRRITYKRVNGKLKIVSNKYMSQVIDENCF